MQKQINVLEGLQIIGQAIDNSNAEGVNNYHTMIYNRLESEGERDAFNFGSLAVLSDVGNMRFRKWKYTRKFDKALRNL